MSKATTLGAPSRSLPPGPVASQVAIKMLGTNGGGFIDANTAHPFKNPNPLSNFIQMMSIFAIRRGADQPLWPDGRKSAAWLGHLAAMLCSSSAACPPAGGPERRAIHVSPPLDLSAETWKARKRASESSLRRYSPSSPPRPPAARSTPCTTLSPLRRVHPADQYSTWRSRLRRGGSGTLWNARMFVIVAIFVAGLMVGRTPEYRRQKDRSEGSQDGDACHPDPAVDVSRLDRRGGGLPYLPSASIANPGPHGFTEVLYAYTSQTGNNGSAFAGLTGNILFYNLTGAIAMMIGRYLDDHPGHGDRRIARRQESVPGVSRHVPDHRRPVHRTHGRRDPHRRWPHVFSCPGARPACQHIAMTAGTLY